MKLSLEEMRALAKRMRLNLSDDELMRFAEDLASLEELSKALLPYAEPLYEESMLCSLANMRADELKPSLSREESFANASQHNGEFLRVPRVVGESES